MSVLPFVLTIVAFALLGLATDAHHRRWLGGAVAPVRRRAFRRTAWSALALAFPAAVMAQGWVFGPILWTGATMLGAAAAFLSLNARAA